MATVVKLNKVQSVRPTNIKSDAKNYPLSKGMLIYTHDRKGQIANKFRATLDFGILNDTSRRYAVYFGTYEGRTESFSATNYLHQRARMNNALASPTGNAVIDKTWEVVNKLANPGDTIAGLLVPSKTKYFVAFRAEDTIDRPIIMHNQDSIIATTWVKHDVMNLAKIFHAYRDFFFSNV